jgi:hypothetical protein
MPKYAGRIYTGKQGTYLAIYNYHPDIYTATPKSVDAKRVAHVAYSDGGKRSGIDVFKIPLNPDLVVHKIKPTGPVFVSQQLPEVFFYKTIKVLEGIEGVAQAQSVQTELVQGANPEVLGLIMSDVKQYCKRPAKASKKSQLPESWLRHVHEIMPVTQARRIKYNKRGMLEPGKQEFVEDCVFVANLDFGQGCLTGWIPTPGASFDGQTFRGFFLDPFSECSYCYAMPNHETFPKNLYQHIEKSQLVRELLGEARLTFGTNEPYGKPVKFLRFGKRTEAGAKYTLPDLITSLEACLETGTRTIMPTKFLESNPEVAGLLKRTNSQVLYSIGWDEFEQGACAHGCTNEWRTEQAIKMAEAGVNAAFYLLIPAHSAPSAREQKILKIAEQRDMRIQLLPQRFTSKALMRDITGANWDIAKRNSALIPDEEDYAGTYTVSAGVASPERIHPSWLQMVEDNNGSVRMCHHNSQKVWCGSCFMRDGFSGPIVHKPRKKIQRQKRTNKKINTPLFDDAAKN